MAKEKKSCKDCAFYWRNGTGYSDWTWMDTEQHCALGKHPDWPDSEDGDEKKAKERLTFAEKCDGFNDGSYDGEPVLISPDGELREGANRAAQMIRLLAK